MDWIKVEIPSHKMDGYIWVKCVAEIRENETNKIVEYETDQLLEIGNEHPNVFNWEENNFSCDCNRRIFFYDNYNEKDDVPCSDGKYSVNLKNKKDGKLYYREFDK